MVSALQQFQIAIDTVAPMQLQGQLGERIQEWSRVISNSIPYQIEPLTNVTYPLGSCEAIRVGSTPTTRTSSETPPLAQVPALRRNFLAERGVSSLPNQTRRTPNNTPAGETPPRPPIAPISSTTALEARATKSPGGMTPPGSPFTSCSPPPGGSCARQKCRSPGWGR